MAAIRTFVAIPLTEEVRRGIGNAVEALRPWARGIRWVPLENLHLTLRFLGGVEEERLLEVHQAVAAAVEEIAPFALRTGGFGAFPERGRPRVLWVALEGDLENLRKLQGRVETELVQRGFPGEDRPFSPHLTVGRATRNQSVAVELPMIAQPGPEMVVREAVVMKSDLHPEGPVYTILFESALKGQEAR